MPWITTKSGKRINTDWFDDDEKKKHQQIEENKKQADEKNDTNKFNDGDTSKVLDDNTFYTVKRISLHGDDKNYGNMSGKDAKELIKGFHYEELVPGDGMWVKDGSKYSFDVTISKR